MLTLLSSAKPFTGLARDNQLNAIRSWLAIGPDVEVILYGETPGAAEVCRELGIRYVPDIASTDTGVPYFNAIVEHAAEHARHDIQVYLNCDILLTQSIFHAISVMSLPQYLMVGQRIDLPQYHNIDVTQSDWQDRLLMLVKIGQAVLHGPQAMDYFAFTRGMWQGLPPLVIGRAGYDAALVAYCLRRHIPVIDGTLQVTALHQFHDYGHVQGGKRYVYGGEESERNRRLHGVVHSTPNASDADLCLMDGVLQPHKCRGDRLRMMELYCRFKWHCEALGYGIRALWRLARLLRVRTTRLYTLAGVLADQGILPYSG